MLVVSFQEWLQKQKDFSFNDNDFFPFIDHIKFKSFGPERVLFGSDWPVCLN